MQKLLRQCFGVRLLFPVLGENHHVHIRLRTKLGAAIPAQGKNGDAIAVSGY